VHIDDNYRLYPQPYATSPKGLQRILDCGATKVAELIKLKEVESYKDGKSRKIVIQSIYDYIARCRAASLSSASELADCSLPATPPHSDPHWNDETNKSSPPVGGKPEPIRRASNLSGGGAA